MLSAAALLSGCADSSDGTFSNAGGAAVHNAASNAPVAGNTKFRNIGTVQPNTSPYKLGPTDVLKVTVFQVADLDREVIVADTGKITMPLVGAVQAGGRSIQEVEREIALRLRKFLQSPQVTVFVKEYNSQKFTVEGAVNNPGVFPIRGQISLLQAIATAKGLNKVGDSSSIIMFRQVNGQKYAAKFNLGAVRLGKLPDPAIIKNDIIYVEESGSKKFFEATRQWISPVATVVRVGALGL